MSQNQEKISRVRRVMYSSGPPSVAILAHPLRWQILPGDRSCLTEGRLTHNNEVDAN